MEMKVCDVCGGKSLTKFKNETLPLSDGSLVHGLNGMRCSQCGEIWLDDDSHEQYGAASDAVVLDRQQTERRH